MFYYFFNAALEFSLLETKPLIHYNNYFSKLPLNADNLNSYSDISKVEQCHLSLKHKYIFCNQKVVRKDLYKYIYVIHGAGLWRERFVQVKVLSTIVKSKGIVFPKTGCS